MLICEFKEGHTIIQENDKGDSLYIVIEGSVSCLKNGKEIRRLYTKDYFGETALLFEIKRSNTISANCYTTCYQISKQVLKEILGANFKDTLIVAICKEAFSKTTLFKNLIGDDYIFRIYSVFKLCFYNNNEIVMPRNHFEARKLIVVVQGNLLNVSKN